MKQTFCSIAVAVLFTAVTLTAQETHWTTTNPSPDPAADTKSNSSSVPDAYAINGHFDRIVVIRLKNGADLLKGMMQVVKEQKIQNGVILSAIGSLRAINAAEASYASSCGQGAYAGTLADLGKPPQAGTEGFIGPDLKADPSTKSGYTLTMSAGAAAAGGVTGCNNPSSLALAYFVAADPLVANSTGTRRFGTNQAGTIYQSTANPPEALVVTLVGAPPGAAPIQ